MADGRFEEGDEIQHSHFYIERLDYLIQCDEVSKGERM